MRDIFPCSGLCVKGGIVIHSSRNMKDITPILRSLGLLDSEIKTYRAALQYGPQTVLDLTKRTGLSRQAIYVAIESLSERGLMSSALHGKKRLYASEHPEKLLSYARRREEDMHDKIRDLERIVPELELQIGGERPTVRVFEGKEGVKAILADMNEARAEQFEEIADLDALYAVLDLEDLKPLRTHTVKMKARSLLSGEPQSVMPKADRYLLPKQYSGFKSNITVYGSKIALVTFEGKMYSVIIESGALAKTLRVLFDLALKEASRDFKKG